MSNDAESFVHTLRSHIESTKFSFFQSKLTPICLPRTHLYKSHIRYSGLSSEILFSSLRRSPMSSGCISGCVDDARVPVRVTYVNLHKWPESDAEFVKSVVYGEKGAGPRVVDSYSCRQMYLRSYTFSREETVPEKTRKCFGRVKQRVSIKKKKKGSSGNGKKKCFVMRKMKEVSCSAFSSIFSRLLSCTTSIDVVDR